MQNGEQEAVVEGSIPEWLSGSIIRNGSGGFSAEMKHTFDGFACLVKCRFKDGKVFVNRRCSFMLYLLILSFTPHLRERCPPTN